VEKISRISIALTTSFVQWHAIVTIFGKLRLSLEWNRVWAAGELRDTLKKQEVIIVKNADNLATTTVNL
jgi:hypothetical protein